MSVVKLYGARRTGTTITRKLAKAAYPELEIAEAYPGRGVHHIGAAKHALPDPPDPDHVDGVLVTVKHPRPWLVSIRRWAQVRKDRIDKMFLELWTAKYELYWRRLLAGDVGVLTHVVRHRDLIEDSERVAEDIQEAFDLGSPRDLGPEIFRRHASPVNHGGFRQDASFEPGYYRDQEYLEDLERSQHQVVTRFFTEHPHASQVLDRYGYAARETTEVPGGVAPRA